MRKKLLALACASIIAGWAPVAQGEIFSDIELEDLEKETPLPLIEEEEEEEEDIPDETWRGTAEVAYSMKRGNTDSDRLRFYNDAEKETESWRHIGQLEAVNEKSRPAPEASRQRTAERYTGLYKLDRKFGEANYIFNEISAERDHFSGFDYEASYAFGYGRRVVRTPRQYLDLEFGPGYRWRRFDEDRVPEGESRQDNEPILQAGLLYNLHITESTRFREDIRAQYEGDSRVARAATTFTTMINDRVSLRLSHILRYNSDRPASIDNTDSELSVGLVVSY